MPQQGIQRRIQFACARWPVFRRDERQIAPAYLGQLNELYEEWINSFTLCPVLAVPADDLDYVPLPDSVKNLVRKQWADNLKDAAGKPIAYR